MDQQQYNGWTNFTTWKVHLEIFDGMSKEDFDGETVTTDMLKDFVDQWVENSIIGTNFIIEGWIRSFLSDVNWQEIADHINEA